MLAHASAALLFLVTLGCGNSRTTSGLRTVAYGAGSKMTLEVNVSARAKGNDIVVELKLVNRGLDSYPLLKWNFPQDGKLTTSLFEVHRNGQIVEYQGLMVKRRVTDADFLNIESGREYIATLGLAQGYEVSPSGRYTIQYTAWNEAPGAKQVISIKSNVVTLEK
jgi:hypothetical protein